MSEIQNLGSQEAIGKLKELAEGIDICLFGTGAGEPDGSRFRPMSTKLVDDKGNIYFLSERGSGKNVEIADDPAVNLFYSDPGKSSFLIVKGRAEICTDREKIGELWSSLDKTWFKEGKDDPSISIIKVQPETAHYWDTEGNSMVNFFKMIASAATGKTLVKGREGSLHLK